MLCLLRWPYRTTASKNVCMLEKNSTVQAKNKAEHTAQDAPSTRLREGVTDVKKKKEKNQVFVGKFCGSEKV